MQITKSDSAPVKGAPELVMTLQQLILNGRSYRLVAEPLVIEVSNLENQGSAATGGSADGEGGQVPKNSLEKNRPGSQFAFVLSIPLELPVIKKLMNPALGTKNRQNASSNYQEQNITEFTKSRHELSGMQ